MKFSFEQTVDDVLEVSKNNIWSSKIIKYIGLGFLMFVLLNGGFMLLNGGVGLKELFNWLYPIVLIMVLWYFIFNKLVKRRLNDPGAKNLLIGHREIELLEEEIIVETLHSKTSLKWAAITSMKSSKNSYFLFMGKSQALIFPKRIFKSDDEIKDFDELVKRKLGETLK